MIVAWIDTNTGTVYCHDYYNHNRDTIYLDNTIAKGYTGEDSVLTCNGTEDSGKTRVRFSRKLDSEDLPYDINIGAGVLPLVWAYGEDDPDDDTSGDTISRHRGTASRGFVFVDFLSGEKVAKDITKIQASHTALMGWATVLLLFTWMRKFLR